MAAFSNTLFLQADLLRAVRRMIENTEKLIDLIKTIRSDEDYPWPPSKAPWAVEQGDTGIPHSGARENFGKNKFKPTPAPSYRTVDERFSKVYSQQSSWTEE